jgi:hypothetical protein
MLKIMARKSESAAPDEPTAEQLAERVRKSGQHQLAAHKLDQLRDRYAAVRQKIAERISAVADRNSDATLKELAAENAKLELAIQETHLELAPLKAEFRAKLELALLPKRKADAARVVAIVALLKDALATLNSTHSVARRHGLDWASVHARDLGDLQAEKILR